VRTRGRPLRRHRHRAVARQKASNASRGGDTPGRKKRAAISAHRRYVAGSEERGFSPKRSRNISSRRGARGLRYNSRQRSAGDPARRRGRGRRRDRHGCRVARAYRGGEQWRARGAPRFRSSLRRRRERREAHASARASRSRPSGHGVPDPARDRRRPHLHHGKRSGPDAVLGEDALDGGPSEVEAQVFECAPKPRVAPRRILARHRQQLPDLVASGGWTTRTAAGTTSVVLAATCSRHHRRRVSCATGAVGSAS
jgi:hypothetical protein